MTVEKLVCLQLSLVGGKELVIPISSMSSVSSTADGILSTGSSGVEGVRVAIISSHTAI